MKTIDEFKKKVREMYDDLVKQYENAVGDGVVEDEDCWDYIVEFLQNVETSEEDYYYDPSNCWDYIEDMYSKIEKAIDEMWVRPKTRAEYLDEFDAFDFGDPREAV